MKIKLISPRMSKRPMDSSFKTQMAPSLALGVLTPERHSLTIEEVPVIYGGIHPTACPDENLAHGQYQ